MIKHYVIYREEYDRCYGGQESPLMSSEKVQGHFEEECLAKLLGRLLGDEDMVEEAIAEGSTSIQNFIDDAAVFNGDGRDYIIIFDVTEDKVVFE